MVALWAEPCSCKFACTWITSQRVRFQHCRVYPCERAALTPFCQSKTKPKKKEIKMIKQLTLLFLGFFPMLKGKVPYHLRRPRLPYQRGPAVQKCHSRSTTYSQTKEIYVSDEETNDSLLTQWSLQKFQISR